MDWLSQQMADQPKFFPQFTFSLQLTFSCNSLIHDSAHRVYFNDYFLLAVDIICDQVPFLDGYAHRGILSGANRIMTEGKETLKKAFEDHPDYRLVLTGHSLGAGTAILISLGFLNNIYADDFPNVKEVKCVALAPPPVYRTGLFFKRNFKLSTKWAEN